MRNDENWGYRGTPKILGNLYSHITLIWVLEGTLGKTMAVPRCPGWTLGTFGDTWIQYQKICMYVLYDLCIYIYIHMCVCIYIYIHIASTYSYYVCISYIYILNIYIDIKKETYCMYKCTNVIKCVHIKSHAQTIYVCQSQHLWMVSGKPVYKPSHE